MEVKGPESISFKGGFQGFTLAERYVLNRYRVTANQTTPLGV
jgi:hypothetical protein